ncbi:MAG: bifunctional riboflavin kinase/FAD synthetase [Candidatus Omnitrophica bacterium]|nr:bifunctional riboflavin kinase/FAD synthetase [Candidatus Omnitrophota bacterium]
MKVLYGYRNLEKKLKDPIIAIGIFDGIHLGHKRVIKRLLGAGRPEQEKVIVTFDPHPQSVLRPDKRPPRIMSLAHRLFILEKMGIHAVVVIRFTNYIASMSPEDFVKKVIGGTGSRKVFVGKNFHFGSGKSGNVDKLKQIGQKYGVDVRIVEPVKKGGKIVSSTWLRKLIRSGRLEKAEKLLRRPVSVLGTVVRGDELGKKLGKPTANIDPHQEVIPPTGVYAVKVDIEGVLYDGVLNIGFKPTFYGTRLKKRKEPRIEVHIMDYEGNLYGRNIEIFFIKKLRKERQYRSSQSLIEQITKDIQSAEKILNSKKILWKIRRYKYL